MEKEGERDGGRNGEGGREGGRVGKRECWEGVERHTIHNIICTYTIMHVALQYTYTATNSRYTTSEAKCTEGNPSHLHS